MAVVIGMPSMRVLVVNVALVPKDQRIQRKIWRKWKMGKRNQRYKMQVVLSATSPLEQTPGETKAAKVELCNVALPQSHQRGARTSSALASATYS